MSSSKHWDIRSWYFHHGNLCGDVLVSTSPKIYEYKQFPVIDPTGRGGEELVIDDKVTVDAGKSGQLLFYLDPDLQDRYFASLKTKSK